MHVDRIWLQEEKEEEECATAALTENWLLCACGKKKINDLVV